MLITGELAKYIAEISQQVGRQLGILVNRKGTVEYVIAGDAKKIIIPELERMRSGPGRLRGLRFLHTHLKGEGLTHDDLTDLALLRLDLIAAIEARAEGTGRLHIAHLLPENGQEKPWEILSPIWLHQLDLNFLDLINSLEEELAGQIRAREVDRSRERAILVSVYTGSKYLAEDSMEELKELVRSSGVTILDIVFQRRPQIHPKYLMGKGKLEEFIIRSMQLGADVIIFDQNLTPVQEKTISENIELKIVDRTQLILDIFAQRAQSQDGKVQVELAQLRYLLPRLATKNTAMSRLTGGIGARGPGETKLEINRRRVRDRIVTLEKKIDELSKNRAQQRAQRKAAGLPIISIIGYTNAGKSTLLNSLTESRVATQDLLFATLDPTSRRLRFPEEREVIITDTVGFIKDLPPDLITAFRPPLEELKEANLLLLIVDISNPRWEDHIRSVDQILAGLKLDHIPRLLVFNKQDMVSPELAANICRQYQGISISALQQKSLPALIETINHRIWGGKDNGCLSN